MGMVQCTFPLRYQALRHLSLADPSPYGSGSPSALFCPRAAGSCRRPESVARWSPHLEQGGSTRPRCLPAATSPSATTTPPAIQNVPDYPITDFLYHACFCDPKCPGQWSDTPHGSHGFSCIKVYNACDGARSSSEVREIRDRPLTRARERAVTAPCPPRQPPPPPDPPGPLPPPEPDPVQAAPSPLATALATAAMAALQASAYAAQRANYMLPRGRGRWPLQPRSASWFDASALVRSPSASIYLVRSACSGAGLFNYGVTTAGCRVLWAAELDPPSQGRLRAAPGHYTRPRRTHPAHACLVFIPHSGGWFPVPAVQHGRPPARLQRPTRQGTHG